MLRLTLDENGRTMTKINIPKLECKRCGHRWWPRKDDVTICPRCKSAYWDKVKKLRCI